MGDDLPYYDPFVRGGFYSANRSKIDISHTPKTTELSGTAVNYGYRLHFGLKADVIFLINVGLALHIDIFTLRIFILKLKYKFKISHEKY